MKKIISMATVVAMLLSVGVTNVFAATVNDTKVKFYVQISGVELDSNGNVSSRPKSEFTGVLGTGTLAERQDSKLTVTATKDDGDAEIRKYLASVPDEDAMFDVIRKTYEASDAVIKDNTGSVIKWGKFSSQNYRIHWYVLKYETGDNWHVDGILVDRATDEVISIIEPDPEPSANDAAVCVKYDVNAGKFTPGVMDIEELRPHNDRSGDNDNEVLAGFDDVWYTVLKKDSFKTKEKEIPQRLMDAAEAVADLAGARLGELDSLLQEEYGRIDSQAWKEEYVNRAGKSTLYVTPFINSELANFDVDRDEYIWLAVGDRRGNIQYVYVMDREMAGIENLFEEE